MPRVTARQLLNGTASFLAIAAIIALFLAYRRHQVPFHAPHLSVSARRLPYYAFCSYYRMLAAYVVALAFSLIYGPMAASSRAAERVLLPAIDIAQSVPVVGFFPAAIYFFVAIAHGGRLGVELAAIFLIFTSMAWNMALGVFESVRTIPLDSLELLDSFGSSRWLKLKHLILPTCVPKLVYNSILSWVAGWYYLIACEIITAGPTHYQLPGLGSFLISAAEKGRSGEMAAGLLVLLAIIVLMDGIVWQPLSAWAEKFRYEFAASSEPLRSLGALDALGAIGPAITRAIRAVFRPVFRTVRQALSATPPFNPGAHPLIMRGVSFLRIAALAGLTLLIVYGVADGLFALVRTLLSPWPAAARQIPAATGASMLRLFTAYLISVGWTVPCAIAASENQRFAQRLTPIAEIVGSIPATALFPFIVLFVIRLTGGMNLASILLILTGMQWYLLFNLLGGVSQIPSDLKEAARSFGLSRVETWRKLTIPALVPSLLTGSITAWGGGWNALILSEYFPYRGRIYQVYGLGALLDNATYQGGSAVMILLTLLAMILVVILLNRLVWRRFYDVATERYKIDY
ncbi:MAG TPA: ABC transporter permease subunit [Candidatus Binataceae bacterium]|nr:ABC transporter permease subunit [Candidatus Binataceae bacterium]